MSRKKKRQYQDFGFSPRLVKMFYFYNWLVLFRIYWEYAVVLTEKKNKLKRCVYVIIIIIICSWFTPSNKENKVPISTMSKGCPHFVREFVCPLLESDIEIVTPVFGVLILFKSGTSTTHRHQDFFFQMAISLFFVVLFFFNSQTHLTISSRKIIVEP